MIDLEFTLSVGNIISSLGGAIVPYLSQKVQQRIAEIHLEPDMHPIFASLLLAKSSVHNFEGKNEYKTLIVRDWSLDTLIFQEYFVFGIREDWKKLKRFNKIRFRAELRNNLMSMFNAYDEYVNEKYDVEVVTKFGQVAILGRSRLFSDIDYILNRKDLSRKKIVWDIFTALKILVDYNDKLLMLMNEVNGALKGLEYKGAVNI